MYVFCEYCVLSGIVLCNRPIPCPGKSLQTVVCHAYETETSRTRQPLPALGCCAKEEKDDDEEEVA
jgi:hypothetical protein